MAIAAAHSTTAQHASHDPARQLRIKRVGLWLFFLSETFLFGLLLSGRFFLTGIEAEHLNQLLGLGITVVLLLSSVTAYCSETAIKNDRQGTAIWFMLATIVLGLVFAGGVAYEWSIAHFSRHEGFGTAFFSMTGMHAFHVLTGVAMLCLVVIQMARKRFGSHDYWPVQGTVMYWHFVDVVWVFFYPALYLVQGV
jgi:cytochrome c oxidase subunit 3